MATESFLLPVHVSLAAVIIETRLANRHHPFVFGQDDQIIDHGLAPFPFIGMHTNGSEHVRMTVCERAYLGEGFQRDRHAQHVPDPVVPGALEHVFQTGV